jgi:hypothetical protein
VRGRCPSPAQYTKNARPTANDTWCILARQDAEAIIVLFFLSDGTIMPSMVSAYGKGMASMNLYAALTH